MLESTWQVLRLLGVDERYLRLKWLSASDGPIFAEEIRLFTEELKKLGRNPLAEAHSRIASAA